MLKKIRNYLKLISSIISRRLIHVWNLIRCRKMAYKFSENKVTGKIHIFECNTNKIINIDTISICGIPHDRNDLKKIIGAIYENKNDKLLAEYALKLYKEDKNVCACCVGSIYGEID